MVLPHSDSGCRIVEQGGRQVECHGNRGSRAAFDADDPAKTFCRAKRCQILATLVAIRLPEELQAALIGDEFGAPVLVRSDSRPSDRRLCFNPRASAKRPEGFKRQDDPAAFQKPRDLVAGIVKTFSQNQTFQIGLLQLVQVVKSGIGYPFGPEDFLEHHVLGLVPTTEADDLPGNPVVGRAKGVAGQPTAQQADQSADGRLHTFANAGLCV